MSDPKALGPAMAVAILTTLYGAIIANVICMPARKKLEAVHAEEQTNNENGHDKTEETKEEEDKNEDIIDTEETNQRDKARGNEKGKETNISKNHSSNKISSSRDSSSRNSSTRSSSSGDTDDEIYGGNQAENVEININRKAEKRRRCVSALF